MTNESPCVRLFAQDGLARLRLLEFHAMLGTQHLLKDIGESPSVPHRLMTNQFQCARLFAQGALLVAWPLT
jgi:hypothetical protein